VNRPSPNIHSLEAIANCFTCFYNCYPITILNNWPGCSNDYAMYAETCFKEFGDRVKHWITFNEPHTVAVQGYDSGLHAPGRCSVLLRLYCKQGSSGTEPYIVAHNIILAHATVSDIYRKKYKVRIICIFLCSHTLSLSLRK
jgi:beta-glucosidase/6-phospho-beta-glucosidase/beta-galactosidase